jgi:hypothetical protein
MQQFGPLWVVYTRVLSFFSASGQQWGVAWNLLGREDGGRCTRGVKEGQDVTDIHVCSCDLVE